MLQFARNGKIDDLIWLHFDSINGCNTPDCLDGIHVARNHLVSYKLSSGFYVFKE